MVLSLKLTYKIIIQVQHCLAGKSGLKFINPSQTSHSARSSDSSISKLSRCKLDSILCGIFNSSNRASCSDRLENCRSLIYGNEECECADLVLSDGRRGDCSNPDPDSNRVFCFVKTSPCVVRDESGTVVETSIPVSNSNRLLHLSYKACNRKNDK